MDQLTPCCRNRYKLVMKELEEEEVREGAAWPRSVYHQPYNLKSLKNHLL